MMNTTIPEILHSANKKVRELLNVHTMIFPEKELAGNMIQYRIHFIENKENTVFKNIEKTLKEGFTDLNQIEYEIMLNEDKQIMKGGNGESTYPYIKFENFMKEFGLYNFKKTIQNNLADTLLKKDITINNVIQEEKNEDTSIQESELVNEEIDRSNEYMEIDKEIEEEGGEEEIKDENLKEIIIVVKSK